MQMFQGGNAPAAVKAPKLPEIKKPGEPIQLPSFGIDAGTIALPGMRVTVCSGPYLDQIWQV